MIDAQLALDALRADGIECIVQGRYLAGAIGELPVDATPCVWVLDDDAVPAARRVLRSLRLGCESTGTDELPAWQCPRCHEWVEGGFEVCWNCRAARPS